MFNYISNNASYQFQFDHKIALSYSFWNVGISKLILFD
jgi:hypothetical protein